MAQQNIDFGTFPDDPDADAIRTAFQKVQNNFSELYTVTSDSSVTSVNRSSGSGITVNAPTGNVVVSANVYRVEVSTSTLSIGIGANNLPPPALYTSGSQTLVIDLPANITTNNFTTTGNANIGGYANVLGNINSGNLNTSGVLAATGNVTGGNLTTGGVLAATGNVTGGNLTTGGTLSVTGNANVGNIGATAGIFTGNIISLNANLGNSASANYFVGDGSLLTNVIPVAGPVISNGTSYINVATSGGNIVSNVAGSTVLILSASGSDLTGYSNVTGNISASNASLGNSVTANYFLGNLYGTANTAATVTSATQSNITSVGTLISLDVNGTINAVAFTANTGIFTGNGSGLSALVGANVSGFVANANVANTAYAVAGANVSGEVSFAATANAVAGANVSGEVSFAATANAVAGANVSGTVANASHSSTANTVTTAAQPNITSTGTLTSLDVTGNITAGNVYANSGTIGANLLTGTLTTNTQSNITQVGTLVALNVTGNVIAGNVYANSGTIQANNFVGNGAGLTNISVGAGSYIENGNSNISISANSNASFNIAGNTNVMVVTDTGANINGYANVSGNITAGNITATGLTGALVTSTQPNITSLGTLTGLTVTGISNLGPNSNVTITGGVANAFLKTNGSGSLSWDTATLLPAQGSATQVIFNDGGSTYAGNANLTFNKLNGALTVGGNVNAGNVSGGNTVTANFLQGVITTSSQPNITEVGSLGYLIVSGNLNAGNIVGNINANNIISGTLSQSRLANSSLTINGTSISLGGSGNVTANTTQTLTFGNYLTGTSFNGGTANTIAVDGTSVATANTVVARDSNGSFSANIITATLSGAATSATTAGTVTTAAQPNITSVGTLTSLAVAGNVTMANSVASSFTITGVTTGITAAGTVQANATALTKAMNVVSTVPSGTGVILPTAVAGMVVYITNTSANSLFVYPGSGAQINLLGTNSAFTHASNATITFIAPTSTQWYTTSATYV